MKDTLGLNSPLKHWTFKLKCQIVIENTEKILNKNAKTFILKYWYCLFS